MVSKILLFLLPTLVYGRIDIRIKSGANEQLADVDFLGSTVDIIPDSERATWGISDSELKDAAAAYSGGRPSDVFVKSPTPWNDLYKTYGWQQVQRTMYPYAARVLGIKTEPVIIRTQEFVNNSTVKATYNTAISQKVTETITNSWSKGGSFEIGQEITYSVEVGVAEVCGTTSFSYTSTWGEDTSKSMAVTVGSASEVNVELVPEQSVIATLTATKGTMEIEVDYRATLDGSVACIYPERNKGHYFWAYNINYCLSAAGKRRSIDFKETIKVGFYSDARATVSDKKSSRKLFELPAKFF